MRGRELLLDLQRSDFLPPWDEEGVRTVATEIVDMYGKLTERTDDGFLVNDAFYGLCMIRNRRYLASYISNRLKKISSLRWEVGTVLPEALRQDTLSQREQDFYRQYCDILGEYNESRGLDEIGFDLSLDLEVIRY